MATGAAAWCSPTSRRGWLSPPSEGDDTERIQWAIDRVSGLPLDDDGFRGAVRLAPGEFQVEGQLRVAASGVVLRGSGAAEGGTVLHATGQDRRPLITLLGAADREFDPASGQEVLDKYVPVGADSFNVKNADQLSVGDTVLVIRPSTEEWIREVHLGWRPRTLDLVWDRVVTGVSGNRVTVDAPITTALEKRFGGGTVVRYHWPGRLERVGVEDLVLVSDCSPEKPKERGPCLVRRVRGQAARRLGPSCRASPLRGGGGSLGT